MAVACAPLRDNYPLFLPNVFTKGKGGEEVPLNLVLSLHGEHGKFFHHQLASTFLRFLVRSSLRNGGIGQAPEA